MKNTLTRVLVISGTVAALSMILTQWVTADVPGPTRIEPIVYPNLPAYPATPGGWSDLFGHG